MYRTLLDVFTTSFRLYADHMALQWRNQNDVFESMTFHELDEVTKALAIGLINLKIKLKQHVALIADVSHTWTMCDIALQRIGAVDVPRGTDSTADELGFILKHSGSKVVFVANTKEIDKIEKGLKKQKYKVTKYVIMDGKIPKKKARKVVALSALIDKGRALLGKKTCKEAKEMERRAKKISPDDVATIIYTSGTTGEPKGVMTTQGNLAFQLNALPKALHVGPDDRGLTLLPPWHIFGRISEYLFLATGCSITYTDIKHIGEDMRNIKPTFVPAVPRIWEGVYNKVIANVKKAGKEGLFNFFAGFAIKFQAHLRVIEDREIHYRKINPIAAAGRRFVALMMMGLLWPLKALGSVLVFKKVLAATGGCLRASISGGGALPHYIDQFFAAIGISIIEGYGMTETSPIISFRRPERIVPGTVGPLIEQTEIKLIDLEGNDVTHILGAQGTLHVRGPQVMKGYYKNPKKTKEVLTKDGWMNTGDLIRINVNGELSIVGRSKDTIVLAGGENVEPTPIEERLKSSAFIDQVMAVGQDAKNIGALLVPNEEELLAFCKANGIAGTSLKELIDNAEVKKLYKTEINTMVGAETGFKPFERVGPFRLLLKPFEQGDELNNTLKVRRHIVYDKYAKLIEEMYA